MRTRVIVLGVVLAALAVPLVLIGLGEESPTAPEDEAILGRETTPEPPAPPILQGTGKDAPRATPEEAEGDLVSYHGEVVDADKEPVAGATVVAIHEARELARTTSGADGTFRFGLRVVDHGRSEWGTVLARSADGRAGRQILALVGKERNVGTIVLTEAHDLEVRIAGSCGAGRDATVYLVEARFGITSALASARTTNGAVRFEALPPGLYRVAAYAEGCGRAASDVLLPREPDEPLVLEMDEGHPLVVTVVDAETEEGIEGAVVTVVEWVRRPHFTAYGPLLTHPGELTTDAAGEARIEGLAEGTRLQLAARAEGYPQPDRRGRGPESASARVPCEAVVLKLTPPHTVRWRIVPGAFPVPPDGTVVRIEPWTNTGRTWVPPEGVVKDGYLVIDGWGSGYASGYAHAPDGSVAQLRADPGAEEGRPITFLAERSVEVVLRFEDGRPAKGWAISVLDGGNNAVRPPVTTDAEGRARMTGLSGHASLVHVQAQEPGSAFYRLGLGSVNLAEKDGFFEGTVPLERTVRVYFRVDGEARLPEKPYSVWILYRPVAVQEEDASSGCVTLRYRHVAVEGEVPIQVKKPGYRSPMQKIALGDVDDVVEVTLDLHRAGSLRAHVKPPEDGRYKVSCQRWNAEKREWVWSGGADPYMFSSGGRRADPNGLVDFVDLEPGRYRAVDKTSSLASAVVEVTASEEPAEVDLDLSHTGWVRGKAEVPEGYDVQGVYVGLRGGVGRGVGKEGEFWVRVPGTHEVVIEAAHPMLRPAEGDGTLRVTEPRDSIVFRFVPGRMATLRFDPPLRQFVNPGQPTFLTVRLYRGAVGGEPVHRTSGRLAGNAVDLSFGGYEAGTYTVWIDANPRAPLVLDAVVLGEGTTNLGTTAAPEGSTLEIRFLVKEGQSVPSYDVFLTKEDEPTYRRRGGVWGGSMIRVRGIGPGRFKVMAFGMNSGTGLDEEIEFDGTSTVERTIDLR